MNSLTLAPQIKPKIYKFRNPTAEDGATVNRLIASCPPLDSNSIYCNLLQCSYFSETSIIAEDNSRIVG
ncbi:MAG: diaminobutyrate acetyltransferase, partial [Gammaproteobacteria bacterium]